MAHGIRDRELTAVLHWIRFAQLAVSVSLSGSRYPPRFKLTEALLDCRYPRLEFPYLHDPERNSKEVPQSPAALRPVRLKERIKKRALKLRLNIRHVAQPWRLVWRLRCDRSPPDLPATRSCLRSGSSPLWAVGEAPRGSSERRHPARASTLVGCSTPQANRH
jgi:hypothetical protein